MDVLLSVSVLIRLVSNDSMHTHDLSVWAGFMDDERADHIVKMAKARLAPSGLALRKGDTMDKQR
jgi:hypothetical protein